MWRSFGESMTQVGAQYEIGSWLDALHATTILLHNA
jgi:hypothetical protein